MENNYNSAAEELKDLIQKYKALKGADKVYPDLGEAYMQLFKKWEIDDYRQFIIELLSILADPYVSSRFQPYHQTNAGPMLYAIEGFLFTLSLQDEMDFIIDEQHAKYGCKGLHAVEVEKLVTKYHRLVKSSTE
ncbi:MAG: hypothetical protein JWQ09_2968 [Segetibacter sp.]|nr:hypothetical protein [Segetibacter sp.]